MHRLRQYKVLLVLLFCLALPVVAVAADKAGATRELSLDFRDVELGDLIQTISEMTGRNFIYDESLKGKVSLISPDRMSPNEAYEAFLTVLNVKGYAVIPSGRTNKIVPLSAARESNLPSGAGRSGSDQYITRLLRLQYVDANLLASTVLAPLVPKTGSIVAYAPSNTLIMTDSVANIERLAKIVRQLDVPAAIDALEIIPLQHAAAEELAELINQLMSHSGAAPVARRGQAVAGAADNRLVIDYPLTNSLIVLATGEDLATVRSLVARLDLAPPDDRAGVNVYYLENAAAEPLAETLGAIITGMRKSETPEAKAAPRVATINPNQITITADKPTNSLIINAGPQEYELLKGIIAKLDVKRKQIFVEALILELSLDATKDLGMSLSGAIDTGDGVVIGSSNLNSGQVGLADFAPASRSSMPSVLSQAVKGMMVGGFFNPISVTGPDGNTITVPAFSALINLSQTDGDVNVLAAPRLLTSDNEEAEIIIGSNVPIITSRLTDTGGSVGLAQSVTVERQDVALTLRFTPQITQGSGVRLNIFQEITDVSKSSVGNVNEVGPTLTKRQLRNTVVAENGRTVVLGGLISTAVQESITKVPLLGDIPFLGWLFKSRNYEERKTNLMIFITPHILNDKDDLERVTQRSRAAMDKFRTSEVDFSQPAEALGLEVIAPPMLPIVQPPAEPAVTPLVTPAVEPTIAPTVAPVVEPVVEPAPAGTGE